MSDVSDPSLTIGTLTACPDVDRFELIDHRRSQRPPMPGMGRVVVAYGMSVAVSLQDDGHTLKVFLADAPAHGREEPCAEKGHEHR